MRTHDDLATIIAHALAWEQKLRRDGCWLLVCTISAGRWDEARFLWWWSSPQCQRVPSHRATCSGSHYKDTPI